MRFIGILLPALVGFIFISIYFRKLDILEKIGIGFLVYFYFFTFVFFLLNLYMGIELNLRNGMFIHLFCLLIVFVLLFFFKRNIKDFFRTKFSFSRFDFLFALPVVIFLGIEVWYGFIFPVWTWDSVAVYDFFGKVFAREGNMASTIRYGYFDSYPYFVSLLHTWGYLIGWYSPLFFHALLYIAFILVVYGYAKRNNFSFFIKWLFVFSIVGVNSLYGHIKMGFNNLPPTIFLSLSFLYAYEWIRTKEYSYLLLSSLLGGGYLWCRNGEPWWISLVLFYLISLFLVREIKWWKKGFLLILSFVFLLTTKVAWEYSLRNWETLLKKQQKQSVLVESKEETIVKESGIDKNGRGFELKAIINETGRIISSVLTPFKYITLERLQKYLPLTFDMFWRAIVQPRLAYWWIVMMLMVLFLSDKSRRKKWELWVWPYFFWINVGMIIVGTYVFIQTFPDWNIPGSAERMSMFLEPLVVCWAITLIGEYLKQIPSIEWKEIFHGKREN